MGTISPPGPFGTQIWPHVAWVSSFGANRGGWRRDGRFWRNLDKNECWRFFLNFWDFVQVRASSCKFVQVRASSCKFVRVRASSCKFVQVRASSCKFVQVRANGQIFAEMWEKCPFQIHRKSSCKFVQVRASSCKFVQVRASACEWDLNTFGRKCCPEAKTGPKIAKFAKNGPKPRARGPGCPSALFGAANRVGEKKNEIWQRAGAKEKPETHPGRAASVSRLACCRLTNGRKVPFLTLKAFLSAAE